MPATDQQLRAIAFLVAACRPYGCKPWDESGIYSNLAKVRDRSLPALVIAAVQAAEDRNAATPGVIPSAGPHWRAPEAAPVPRQTEPAHAMCATCGEVETICRARWAGDHDYLAVERTRGSRSDEERERTRRMAEAVKCEIQHAAERPDVPTAVLEPNPDVQELRDVVAKARAHPETPDPTPAEPKEGAA